MNKKIITATVVTLFIAAALSLLPHLSGEGEKAPKSALVQTPSNPSVPVITAVATIEMFTETLEALGTARAMNLS